MAVLSRPSLRSSSRKQPSPEEVPPTDVQQKPQTNTRRGKRTRDQSLGNGSSASVKKQKPSPIHNGHRSNDIPKYRAHKSLPLRDKHGTQDAVTSRPPDYPPRQINGFPDPTPNTATTHNDSPPIRHNNSLTIKTSNTLNQAEKRSLRSHDGGSRSKSELALYFPNYDELVSIEPKEPGGSLIL